MTGIGPGGAIAPGTGAAAAREPAGGAPATAPVRRLVCLAPNAAVDKIAAVDRLIPGEIHRPDVLSVVAGGKTLNVARAGAALGLPVVAVPVVAGHAGAWVVDGLAADGVAAQPVWIAGETRECLSILDRSTGLLTELYEAGPAVDDADWRAIEAAVAAALEHDPAGTVVAISGSLPGGAPADGHARIARLGREAGARVAVDTGGAALAAALRERPWLAKANAAEAAAATGVAVEPGDAAGDAAGEAGAALDAALDAARTLQAGGAANALVTLGARGAVLADADGAAWRIGPPPELGAFPVGSGDSLLGGLVAALAAGLPLPEAARRGAAAAAANALRPAQGRIDPADVVRLLPGITLEPLGGPAA
jgi:1-phosphofructokinase family hexose kinase